MQPTLFEQILSTNLINFLIVISTLVWIFKKANLGDLIANLAENISQEIEKSSNNAQLALKEYKNTKKETKNTPKLQEEIINNAKETAQNLKEKIEKKTNTQKDEIINSIEKVFSKQNEKMKKLTANEIYLACIDMAQEHITEKLDENTHKKLINLSIEELDKIEGSLSWTKIST